jgi:signal transduction histidine kinase
VSQDTELTLEVRDDGRGFRLPAPGEADEAESRRGLRNMRDRLEAVGGRLTIDAAPGRGTRVFATVPFL